MTNLWIETHSGDLVNLEKVKRIHVDQHLPAENTFHLGIDNSAFVHTGTKAECEAARDAIKKLIEQKTAAFVPSITKMVAEMEK